MGGRVGGGGVIDINLAGTIYSRLSGGGGGIGRRQPADPPHNKSGNGLHLSSGAVETLRLGGQSRRLTFVFYMSPPARRPTFITAKRRLVAKDGDVRARRRSLIRPSICHPLSEKRFFFFFLGLMIC